MTTTYPLSPQDTQPRFVEYLSANLASTHQVTVLAPAIQGDKGDAIKVKCLEVIRFRYFFSRYEMLCGGDGILENLKRSKLLVLLIPFMIMSQLLYAIWICHKQKIDVIHAHWILPQGLIALITSLILGRKIKILVTSHGGDLFALRGSLASTLKMYVIKHSHHVTVVSEAMKSFCINQWGIRESKISVGPMGVNLKHTFKPHGLKQNNKLVFVGRLAEKKGLGVLIKALKLVGDRSVNFDADIIGGGANLASYESQVARSGLQSSIHFKGALNNKEVVAYLQLASVAVFPFVVASDGDQEGLGLTMVEAMGCECVTIASNLPAVRDVIDDNWNGYLVEPSDPLALADKIEQVLKGDFNRDALVKNARQSVLEKFDWSKVGKTYSQLIENLV